MLLLEVVRVSSKLPEGFDARRKISGHLGGHVHFQELIEVAVLGVFHDYAERRIHGAHAQDAGNVLVLQTGQNSHVVLQLGSEKTNGPR